MQKVLNEEVYNKVKKYIQDDREKYTFENLLKEKGLLENASYKGDSITICCPFHEDLSPSCGVSLTKKVYNCFSCGRGGSYLQFLNEYKKEIEGTNIGMRNMINNILMQDRVMQSVIGTASIWKAEDTLITSEFKLRRPKLLSFTATKNALEYAKDLKMQHASVDDILDFVSKLQAGFEMSQIVNSNKTPKEQENKEVEDESLVYNKSELGGLNLKDFL